MFAADVYLRNGLQSRLLLDRFTNFAALVVFLVAIPLFTAATGSADANGDAAPSIGWLAFGPTALFGALYLLTYYGVDAAITRLVLRGTAAGPHQLRCDWTLTMLLWIQASNLVAIVLSLGLVPPEEHEQLGSAIQQASDLAEQHLDLEAIENLARQGTSAIVVGGTGGS